MPRSHYRWQQFFADTGDSTRRRRRHESREAGGDALSDVAAWIAAYLDRPTEGDEGHPRRSRRGFTRRFDFNTLFEDGTDPSVWPDEVHEHLAALRDRLHGISASQHGRGRNKHARWGRRREGVRERETEARDAAHSHDSSRPRRFASSVATRLAVMIITAVVARMRTERSRRRRGFSV